MGRHWGFLTGIDIGPVEDPYIDRLRLFETPWLSLYLHKIHRPDVEPDPHDHPWPFASLVLLGGYREVTWPDKHNDSHRFSRYRARFSVRLTRRRAAHMITEVRSPLWTLVLAGPDKGEWGYYQRGEYTRWQDYFSPEVIRRFEEGKAAGRK